MHIHNSKRRRPPPSQIAYAVLSFIQFTCSAALLIFGVFRFWNNYKTRNTFVDFDRPEGLDLLVPEGLRLLRERTAASIILPAFFQLLSSVFGFWPFAGRQQKSMQVGGNSPSNYLQILQLIFCLLSVFLWLRAAEVIGMELNVSFVQLRLVTEE